ncbi:hypothetical protein RGQ13_10590 [Thalassotalea psychrophila]|uniref:Lipoprotein n=1 Tax=Thalassotalea psychrophila TaxID=3065647 RepID=A0ABY9TP64_9GAMM|nr:hypothetical protein RGQ13_10590 [Colwelliaceae bacterium SQ149]
MGKRFLFFIICFLWLSGCVSSSHIASIGARATHGTVTVDHESSKKVSLTDSDLIVSDKLFRGDYLPFTNLQSAENGSVIQNIEFDTNQIKWLNSSQGILTVLIDDEFITFDVTKKGDQLFLEHRYRNWYSYPTQTLLLVSMPVDIVLGTVTVLTAMVFAGNGAVH